MLHFSSHEALFALPVGVHQALLRILAGIGRNICVGFRIRRGKATGKFIPLITKAAPNEEVP
jgi:hypothetical protein